MRIPDSIPKMLSKGQILNEIRRDWAFAVGFAEKVRSGPTHEEVP